MCTTVDVTLTLSTIHVVRHTSIRLAFLLVIL